MKEGLIGKSNISYKKGGSTLELLIAFAVITLSIGAVILISFGNQSLAIDTETNNEALQLAHKMIEDTKALSYQDFALINPISEVTDNTYSKSLLVEPVDFWTKRVTGQISWGVGTKNLGISLSTLITNVSAVDGGDTCSSVLSGDWKNPQLVSYEFGKDLIFDESSGFPIGDIDVRNGTLYVVVNNSNGNNMPTFFKFDLDPQNPPNLISSIDNNPNVRAGFNALHVNQDYAYLASANGSNFNTCSQSISCSQLQIIDLNNMVLVGRSKMLGVTGSGGQAVGKSIFYKDGLIYLGLSKTGNGPEFHILDVGSGIAGGSPTNPVHLGSYPIGNAVNAIFVSKGLAYIASPNDQELKVLDVRNPNYITEVGGFDAPGGINNYGNGKSLYLVGNDIYLGRTLLSDGNELYVLDGESMSTNLPILGSQNILNSDGSNTSVNGILVRDFLVFLLTNDNFQILEIDRRNTPYMFSEYADPLATPAGSSGTTMDCEGNDIYFASLPNNDKSYVAKITPSP